MREVITRCSSSSPSHRRAGSSHGRDFARGIAAKAKQKSILAALMLALALPCMSCIPAIREASQQAMKGAVPGAVQAGLESLEEETTRRRIAQIMATPEVRHSMEELAANFAEGATHALTNGQIATRLTSLANAVVAAATRASIDATLSEVSTAANQKQMQELVASEVRIATREAMVAIAAELPAALGQEEGSVRARERLAFSHNLVLTSRAWGVATTRSRAR